MIRLVGDRYLSMIRKKPAEKIMLKHKLKRDSELSRLSHYAARSRNKRGCKIGKRDGNIRDVIASSHRRRHRSLIGGPTFSAGAGGNAALAPCCSACESERAGSGAGVVGRVPPGFDSAGLS